MLNITNRSRWKYAEEHANERRKQPDHRHVAIVTTKLGGEHMRSDGDEFDVISSDEPLTVLPKQAIWDMLIAMGYDADGDKTADALVYPSLGEVFVEEMKRFRDDQEEADQEYRALDQEVRTLRAELAQLRGDQ